MNYLLITEEFAQKHNGYTNSPFIFLAIKTNAGQWVCDAVASKQFPDIFKGHRFSKIELEPADLMPDYSNLTMKADGKYPVLSRTENYEEETVHIVYIVDGEQVSAIEKVTGETVTKTGYSVDMEETIKMKEAARTDRTEIEELPSEDRKK